MDAVGTGLVPSMAWIKTKATADTPGYSVMLRPAEEAPEATVERIKDALVDLDAIDPVAAPTYTDADLCTLYPIADVHVGMRAWAKEVGEAYDTDKATERLVSWIGQCVAASPAAHTAIVLDVGDLTHADSNDNQTPRSKHQLDVDTRHFRTLDATIQALAVCTELALAKHQRVIVRILPGNHNINSYMAVMFALAERFRDNDRVSVQKVPGEFLSMSLARCCWPRITATRPRQIAWCISWPTSMPKCGGARSTAFCSLATCITTSHRTLAACNGSNYGQLHPATPTP
jgi:hypothetical protein